MAGLTNPMQPAAAPAGTAAPVGTAGGTPPSAPPSNSPQNSAVLPGGTPQSGGPQPGQQQPKGAPITAGPVDADLYKKFVANLMTTVTGSLQAISKMVSQSQDKPAALAHATVQVVIRVEDSLEQSGGKLNLNMTFNAGAEALNDIVDAMQKMGVHDFNEQEINSAFLQAVDQYRMIRQQQGRLDPAMFQQLLQQMKQQEANGTLDKSLPGLSKAAQKMKPSTQQQGQQPQGDGDAEDQQDGGADEATEDQAPETGTQDFPASALKKTQPNAISVKAHYRNRKQKRKAPKMKGQPGGNQPPMRQPVKPNNKGAV